MIFKETKELLQKTEILVFGSSDKLVKDSFIGYILEGINLFLILRTLFIAIAIFAAIFLISIFTNPYYNNVQHIVANIVISIIIGIACAPLTVPRKSLDSDIKEDDVMSIVKNITENDYDKVKLQVIENNLGILKNSFDKQMIVPRGLIGIFWAIYIFFLTNYSISFIGNGKIKIQDAKTAGAFLFLLLFFYILERCYSRTVRRIYMTLSFALNEAMAEKE